MSEQPAEVKSEPKLTLEQQTRRVRQSALRDSDIAAISDSDRAKNFATNQGVKGYTDRAVSNSELATARAMAEVYAGFNARCQEMEQAMQNLAGAFEKVARIQSGQLQDAIQRLAVLEERWWNRLWIDLVWDVLGVYDFCRGWLSFLGIWEWRGDEIFVDIAQDPAISALDEYLNPEHPDGVEEGHHMETTMCACGHHADFHDETGGCLVVSNVEENGPECGCTGFTPIGTTLTLVED